MLTRRGFLSAAVAATIAPLLPSRTEAVPLIIAEQIPRKLLPEKPVLPTPICPQCCSHDFDVVMCEYKGGYPTKAICCNPECGTVWQWRTEITVKKWEDFEL